MSSDLFEEQMASFVSDKVKRHVVLKTPKAERIIEIPDEQIQASDQDQNELS